MKAIGATNELVLGMFVLEAGFIGLVGGIIGTTVGYLIAFAVGFIAEQMNFALIVRLDFALIAGALLFAMLVGKRSGMKNYEKAELFQGRTKAPHPKIINERAIAWLQAYENNRSLLHEFVEANSRLPIPSA
ncbi:MAG: FtsX-like permease family protein [Candidatus Diapherotrites archaeon]|uniref:FtsX-like permease family protein n=1 Tax=Candidatus Iainarchaeum sp. TaxID=3101447 RepID=A0A8T4KSI8_9ARCH|nr:FtsX-like permease family protein [Candidatus Diapherotrites archaeon]